MAPELLERFAKFQNQQTRESQGYVLHCSGNRWHQQFQSYSLSKLDVANFRKFICEFFIFACEIRAQVMKHKSQIAKSWILKVVLDFQNFENCAFYKRKTKKPFFADFNFAIFRAFPGKKSPFLINTKLQYWQNWNIKSVVGPHKVFQKHIVVSQYFVYSLLYTLLIIRFQMICNAISEQHFCLQF